MGVRCEQWTDNSPVANEITCLVSAGCERCGEVDLAATLTRYATGADLRLTCSGCGHEERSEICESDLQLLPCLDNEGSDFRTLLQALNASPGKPS